jgi:hypothetical protein
MTIDQSVQFRSRRLAGRIGAEWDGPTAQAEGVHGIAAGAFLS